MSEQPGFDSLQPADLPDLTAKYPVLLSDDDMCIVRMVKVMLEHAGLTVLATLDPRDTLRVCQLAPVSLVISDIMKPHMNGFELLDALRTEPVTAPLAFMFLTSNCHQARRIGQQAGADACLCKPFSRRELVEMVEWLLLRRAAWQIPPTCDVQVCDTLFDSSATFAAGRWHDRVWTVRRLTGG